MRRWQSIGIGCTVSTDLVELDIAGEELREYIVLNRRHHWRHHHELVSRVETYPLKFGALGLDSRERGLFLLYVLHCVYTDVCWFLVEAR